MFFRPLDNHHSAEIAIPIEDDHFDVACFEVLHNLAREFPALDKRIGMMQRFLFEVYRSWDLR